jgi:ketosteroid isomerase-like protein
MQAVNGGDGSDVDDQEDMMALDALCTAVPPELARAICDKETSKEAWDTIATMRVGDKRVKENSAQKLRRDFELAAFKEGETVEDFALRLTGMQASLQTLGEELEDKQIVLKMMRSVPAKYQQMVVSIRTLMDVSTLTVADLTGHLKAPGPSTGLRPHSTMTGAVHDGGRVGVQKEEEGRWRIVHRRRELSRARRRAFARTRTRA